VTRGALLAWCLLAVWSAWIFALQGSLAAAGGAWVPDLGLVLLLALAPRLSTASLPLAGLAVALGRIAVSIEPPLAVLAGYLAVVAFARGLRSVVEIRSALPRTLLAAACAFVLARWFAFVHEARESEALALSSGLAPESWPELAAWSWSVALASGVAALLLGPALVRLPGLSPLHRRSAWPAAASRR